MTLPRRHRIAVLLFLAAAPLLTPVAALPAQPPAAPTASRNAIQGAYDRMDAAISRKDVRGAFAHYAPDYAVRYQGQTMPLSLQRDAASRLLKRATQVRSTTRIRNLRMSGANQAVVTAAAFFRASLTPEGKAKKGGRLDVTGVSEDVWVKSNGIWRLKRSSLLRQSVSGDAQP